MLILKSRHNDTSWSMIRSRVPWTTSHPLPTSEYIERAQRRRLLSFCWQRSRSAYLYLLRLLTKYPPAEPGSLRRLPFLLPPGVANRALPRGRARHVHQAAPNYSNLRPARRDGVELARSRPGRAEKYYATSRFLHYSIGQKIECSSTRQNALISCMLRIALSRLHWHPNQ